MIDYVFSEHLKTVEKRSKQKVECVTDGSSDIKYSYNILESNDFDMNWHFVKNLNMSISLLITGNNQSKIINY